MSALLMLLPGLYSIFARGLPVARRWADLCWMYAAVAAIAATLGEWDGFAVAMVLSGFFWVMWVRVVRFYDDGSEKIPGRPRDYR